MSPHVLVIKNQDYKSNNFLYYSALKISDLTHNLFDRRYTLSFLTRKQTMTGQLGGDRGSNASSL